MINTLYITYILTKHARIFRGLRNTLPFFIGFLLTSCGQRELFKSDSWAESSDSLVLRINNTPYSYRLSSDDKLSVSIWGHDELSVGSLYGIYNSNEVYGKWVMIDPDGNATLPSIDKIHVAGLTLSECEDTLRKVYGELIKKPIIEVKVLNLKVSILGEIKTPGEITIDKEVNTLVEILAKSGGLSFYSNPKKIKIIRGDLTGEPEEFLIDLTLFTELQKQQLLIYPNDIIYIPATLGKSIDKKLPTLIPLTGIISSIAILSALLNKK